MTIKRLYLENFRAHKTFLYEGKFSFILLEGPNGAGKTSILEAISFLAPGKGLRNVNFNDAVRTNTSSWTAFAQLENEIEETSIGMSCGLLRRRTIKVDDKPIRSSAALLDKLRVIWMTPSQDELLAESKSLRRKFLDRLAYNFDANHAESIAIYEHTLRSRLKLLKGGESDDIWLTQLEKILAEKSLKISAARLDAIARLKLTLNTKAENFLAPEFHLKCDISNNLSNASFNEILKNLRLSRKLDARVGKSLYGVHRADFVVLNPLRALNANKSSTGELKAMLISIMLSQVRSLNQIDEIKPILLLDDIFAHLDKNRANALYEELNNIDAQIWISGTNFSEFTHNNKCEKYIKILV